MLAIARYALKSPFHAATVVGVLAILSLFIPLVSILSGAIVGLIILTQGLYSGARAIVVSIIGITAVSYLILGSAELGITIGLVQWLPMMVLAEMLRRTLSLSFVLVAGMVLAIIAVAVQFTLWPNSEALWTELLMSLLQGGEQPGVDMAQFEAAVQSMVHWMTLMLMAVMYSTFIATLMASRWFQARLAGSQGYREEFYAIRLGRVVAVITLLVSAISVAVNQDWLLAMVLVMLAAFLYQGLAVLHSLARARSKGAWLVLLYILMVIFPQVVGLTALLGVLDNWIDLRAKLKPIRHETD